MWFVMEAQKIIRALTPKRIAAHVGVTENAVYNVKAHFPARWYPLVRDLCAEAGIDCPDGAFKWARQQETGTAL